ncbi:hypothetical protein HJB56_26260 [Rhizobium lentis]|uniref:Rap1a/Tai family immunity protein n=1 Tax=Rhizobium TaxID=379 RepID=UPI0011075703|nr:MULTISPECIES: Rap1a/Tai family immunity protein [Rhizobium]MBX4972626.1 hypothetical protein [Rhizobium lentis]MBX5086234.1 hypothetical protein [Rhizobium lentis]MBX5096346.1 hypothetical protein [Rhizobium lentis]MBX5123514.1 hypothetical protein [Rhizobium lentis]TLX11755.1 hypothetical protein FFR93_19950 [Rhizobium sp. MHM7A]
MKRPAVLRFVLPLLALFSSTTAHADPAFMTGNKLFEYCQTNRLFVVGYMMGVVDKGLYDSSAADYGLTREPDSRELKVIGTFVRTNRCVPDGATSGQMVDVICKWLNEHPADRHKYGPTLINNAFAEVWPCE